MEENEDVPPVPEEETNKEEQRIPTDDERIEHLYAEIGRLRSEIAELRAHGHPDLAHATHDHPEHARHDHKHDLEKAGGTTEPLATKDEPRTEDESPRPVHPYFRRVKFGR